MVALYVTSQEKGSGKTTVCAGLGKYLQNTGKKIGYFKPVPADGGKTAGTDGDAEFMKNLFVLEEPVDLLCPALSGKGNLAASVKEAYGKVSQGKDVVIVEGTYQSAGEIAEALGAKVIVIETYSRELAKKAGGHKNLGELLLGVVVNKVPESRIEQARSESGENVLGILPEDRVLLTLTIGELAERVEGEVLRGAEQSAELVENIMVGALAVDHGPEYFGRKANKMVILRSDRPDMQMAAMETSTRCLVLTGDTPLKSVVLDRAEEKNMPVILVKADTSAVVENIEDALSAGRFNQENKLPRLTAVIERHLDLKKINKGLGLAR